MLNSVNGNLFEFNVARKLTVGRGLVASNRKYATPIDWNTKCMNLKMFISLFASDAQAGLHKKSRKLLKSFDKPSLRSHEINFNFSLHLHWDEVSNFLPTYHSK